MQFPSEEACCAADGSGAFPGGCFTAKPCYTASAFYPKRQCGLVSDPAICSRGWGECCAGC